ncbi:hypothetical protein, partial [Ralstonia pseudosolanacearum]
MTRITHASSHYYPRSHDNQAPASSTHPRKRNRDPAHDASSSFDGLPRRTDSRRHPEHVPAPKR